MIAVTLLIAATVGAVCGETYYYYCDATTRYCQPCDMDDNSCKRYAEQAYPDIRTCILDSECTQVYYLPLSPNWESKPLSHKTGPKDENVAPRQPVLKTVNQQKQNTNNAIRNSVPQNRVLPLSYRTTREPVLTTTTRRPRVTQPRRIQPVLTTTTRRPRVTQPRRTQPVLTTTTRGPRVTQPRRIQPVYTELVTTTTRRSKVSETYTRPTPREPIVDATTSESWNSHQRNNIGPTNRQEQPWDTVSTRSQQSGKAGLPKQKNVGEKIKQQDQTSTGQAVDNGRSVDLSEAQFQRTWRPEIDVLSTGSPQAITSTPQVTRIYTEFDMGDSSTDQPEPAELEVYGMYGRFGSIKVGKINQNNHAIAALSDSSAVLQAVDSLDSNPIVADVEATREISSGSIEESDVEKGHETEPVEPRLGPGTVSKMMNINNYWRNTSRSAEIGPDGVSLALDDSPIVAERKTILEITKDGKINVTTTTKNLTSNQDINSNEKPNVANESQQNRPSGLIVAFVNPNPLPEKKVGDKAETAGSSKTEEDTNLDGGISPLQHIAN